MNIDRIGRIKAGNAGLVVTTAGNDLLHTLPVATSSGITGARSAVITKITAYVPVAVAGNVTLQFGTLNRAGAPAFVQLIPTLTAINNIDTEWTEDEIPGWEWMSWPQLTAAGRTGDIYVLASAATVLVMIEVREYGA